MLVDEQYCCFFFSLFHKKALCRERPEVLLLFHDRINLHFPQAQSYYERQAKRKIASVNIFFKRILKIKKSVRISLFLIRNSTIKTGAFIRNKSIALQIFNQAIIFQILFKNTNAAKKIK